MNSCSSQLFVQNLPRFPPAAAQAATFYTLSFAPPVSLSAEAQASADQWYAERLGASDATRPDGGHGVRRGKGMVARHVWWIWVHQA